jgi:CRP-like cAMP-binding protein
LTEVSYEAGSTVIIEGDTGNKFYIVLEGVLVAYKGKS